jgi:tRNA (adenine22-N1)-methyltransferase
VRFGVPVADIGTDHAHLCAYLAARGENSHLLACDIAEKPLQNAAQTLAHYGLTERVTLRQSDGLDAVAAHEADDILLLGMGGTLMVRILSRAQWLKNPQKQLILQPMSRAEELRAWLCANGFSIAEEAVIREGRRLYNLLRAHYTGVSAEGFAPDYIYLGELPKVTTDDAKALCARITARREKEQTARAMHS